MPYIGTSPSNGVRRVHTYTATASQTTFTGASSEGVTLSYADTNYIDVFQNGVLLGSADYTSTSGTSVVLAQGASADDLIVIVVYDVFSVADTVSKTNGGSFDSGVTVSGTTTSTAIQILNGSNVNTASTDADDLIIEGPNDCGLSILSATTGRIFFGDASNDDAGSIRYVHSDDSMRFEANDEEAMRIHSIGAVTKPLQPAFLAQPSTNQNNLSTGTTTVVFGTEVYDQNGDFASNTFTAPVTGKYFLGVSLYLLNLDSASGYYQVDISTSNRKYYELVDPQQYSGDLAYFPVNIGVVADMDASDTAYIRYVQSSGSAQTDINTDARFMGYLLG